MSELKPCPFCGAEAHLWRWNYGVAIDCSKYDPKTHQVSVRAQKDEDAIAAWNSRTSGKQCRECYYCNTEIAQGEWFGSCGYWNTHSVMADDSCSRWRDRYEGKTEG